MATLTSSSIAAATETDARSASEASTSGQDGVISYRQVSEVPAKPTLLTQVFQATLRLLSPERQQQVDVVQLYFLQYKDEHDLPSVMELIDRSLSEPYSVFTYRYFLHQWPNLCYLAFNGSTPIGVIVCKMDDHRGHLRGYIAMLVMDNTYRGKGLGMLAAARLRWRLIEGVTRPGSHDPKGNSGGSSSSSSQQWKPATVPW
eukprot:GHUV01029667.1.p1 GENE.GHUV01029667.1~~GHUV01029667.1.p1  ORF type:complete len:202 (+),score=63.43 GHUV01029667.1:413-1018(+)